MLSRSPAADARLALAIERARAILTDPRAQLLLRGKPFGLERAAAMLAIGRPPPRDLGVSASLALQLGADRKGKHGNNPALTLMRNCFIFVAVMEAASARIPRTRARTRHGLSDKPSACAVVAQILKDMQIKIGERRVEEIVRTHHRKLQQAELDEARILAAALMRTAK